MGPIRRDSVAITIWAERGFVQPRSQGLVMAAGGNRWINTLDQWDDSEITDWIADSREPGDRILGPTAIARRSVQGRSSLARPVLR